MALEPQHPVPAAARKWGYDHLPLVYDRRDPQATAMTEGSVAGSLLRLVGGFDRERETWSRAWDSWISLDTYSIGVAHWWAETAPGLLARIAREEPILAAWAWGDDGAKLLDDPDKLRALTGTQRGKMPHRAELDWLLAGWYEIARHPRCVAIQADHWLGNYARKAWERMERYGWHRASSLAALARMANSGGLRHIDAARKRLGSRADESDVCELALGDGYYDHPERWDAILADPVLAGEVDSKPTADDLRLTGVAVVRVDGTYPVMYSRPLGFAKFISFRMRCAARRGSRSKRTRW